MRKSASDLAFSFLGKKIKRLRAKASSGKASDCRLVLNPTTATIQLLAVVPRLEPSTTARALRSGMMPAPTKESTMSTTTELLCITAVTSVPLNNPRSEVEVCFCKNFLNERPDNARRELLMSDMAKRNAVTPPNSCHMLNPSIRAKLSEC